MIVKDGGQAIQAMPVTASTYVGTPTSLDPRGFDLVHCLADVNLEFNFGAGGVVSFQATAGSDFAIGEGCVGITADGEVMIS